MERAFDILAQTAAQAGPYVAGTLLVFILMLWQGTRGTNREVDKMILRTGQGIIAVLLLALIYDLWKGV